MQTDDKMVAVAPLESEDDKDRDKNNKAEQHEEKDLDEMAERAMSSVNENDSIIASGADQDVDEDEILLNPKAFYDHEDEGGDDDNKPKLKSQDSFSSHQVIRNSKGRASL